MSKIVIALGGNALGQNTQEQHDRLMKLCNERNLFISGGSDFHGKIKPDVDIGVGYGNMQIPDNTINSWKNNVEIWQ